MRLFNLLLWVVVGLVVFSAVNPAGFTHLKDKVLGRVSDSSVSFSTGNSTYELEGGSLVNDSSDDDGRETSLPPEDPADPCTWHGSGYADYSGTNKEGDTCADVPVDNDLECVNNPPVNFDGSIDKLAGTSDPSMSCCLSDGTCRWRAD